MFQKVALLEILRSPLLTECRLTEQSLYATKNELLSKFLQVALELTENFHEVLSNAAPYQKFTNLQNAAFSHECF